MRLAFLFGLIGVGLAGCNGASTETSAADVAARTSAGESTGSHIHARVGSAGAQSLTPDALYGASGTLPGGNNGGATPPKGF